MGLIVNLRFKGKTMILIRVEIFGRVTEYFTRRPEDAHWLRLAFIKAGLFQEQITVWNGSTQLA